jgi:chemotaxis protein CheD
VSAGPSNDVRVKVADFATGAAGTRLATIGLGSCVAIALHDAAAGVGGLAHILLPDETLARDTSNPAKFPGTVVPVLVAELRRLGSRGADAVTARIAGGASMFAQLLPAGGINMGERNVDATRRALQAAGIRLVGQDTGGDHGRSVYFDVATGRVLVKSLKRGDIVL